MMVMATRVVVVVEVEVADVVVVVIGTEEFETMALGVVPGRC